MTEKENVNENSGKEMGKDNRKESLC